MLCTHVVQSALVLNSLDPYLARRRTHGGWGVAVTCLAVALGIAIVGCESPDENALSIPPRVAVRWRAVTISTDRRTIHVFASYPLSAGCVKTPAGVDLDDIDGDTAVLSVWMTGDGLTSPSATCTAECSIVPQDLSLSSPLPPNVSTFVPTAEAVEGCYEDDLPFTPESPGF